MRPVSTTDIETLGENFGIKVDDTRREDVTERVNRWLANLRGLDDLVIQDYDGGETRAWREPADDAWNAIAVTCDISRTESGPLAGVTVGIKDIIAVAGVPMQCASRVMQGYVPGFDAAVVDRLLAAGATITMKTNLDEFAASGSGTTSVSGPIRNPHDQDRTAGGSSGGSAAAVAAGQVDTALGTDTGGSIRIPAAFCGIVGLKPTYGLVPLHGIVENTYTQDHVGPMTTSVADTARVLDVIAGADHRDPASLAAAGRRVHPGDGYLDAVADPPALDTLTLGVLDDGFGDGVSDRVENRIHAVLEDFEAAGGTVESVGVDHYDVIVAIKDTLSVVELAAHWRAGGAQYRRGGLVDEGYQVALASRRKAKQAELQPHYASKLLAGARIIDAYDGQPYVRAQAAREVLRSEFEAALAGVDALCFPTMPDIAPRIEDAGDPALDYGRNTRAADITRLPAITIPAGRIDGLPVGVQLMGNAFDEPTLLGIGARFEDQLTEDIE